MLLSCSMMSLSLVLSIGCVLSADSVGAAVKRPNFVFIFLDDMRLDDMVAMPKVREYITDRGTNVTNFFVNTPVCCPSRATLFSGRYPHNNRKTTPDVTVPCCMHMDLLFGAVPNASSPPQPGATCSNPGFWQRTWNMHLQQAGYNTGIFGKAYHMGDDAPCGFAGNGYGPRNDTVLTNTSKPFMLPGWDRHFVYCYPLDQYFWNRYNDQGELVGTRDAPEDYATAVLGNKTVEWLRDTAIPEAQRDGGRPFFAYVPLHPPHGLTQPAPWYNESWPAEWWFGPKVPRTRPNYGFHGTDKHWLIANEPAITPVSAAATDKTFVERLQMLLSVNDVIDEVVGLLTRTDTLDDTYLLISADHGWNLGEFRVMNGKHQVYEHTLRVPFAIAGPGIRQGAAVPDVMSMVDVAPTLLELAGADATALGMDGRSFAPVLLSAGDDSGTRQTQLPQERTTMLVEYFSLENTALNEPPCRPTPPGTGPYVAKKGRGGCPASEALYSGANFTTLKEVEAVCTRYNCGLWIWSRDPSDSYHHAFFCKYDTYQNVRNADQFPLWTVGHRKPEAHVVSDGEMSNTAAALASSDPGGCFDLTQSHSDVANNTFIGLRIINSTHDWTYAEYTDVRDWNFDSVYFRELYDVRADPFQLRNIWPNASAATKAELHALLRREFTCNGASCEF